MRFLYQCRPCCLKWGGQGMYTFGFVGREGRSSSPLLFHASGICGSFCQMSCLEDSGR